MAPAAEAITIEFINTIGKLSVIIFLREVFNQFFLKQYKSIDSIEIFFFRPQSPKSIR